MSDRGGDRLEAGLSVALEQDVSLAPWTWWKVGGPAEFLVRPRRVEELSEALQWAASRGLTVTVLGGGSNVLVSDQGVRGLVVSMREMVGCESEKCVVDGVERLVIRALAGTNKAELTKIFLQNKLAPALFLCGLPGDVGGGVVMNAGVGEMITPREFVEIVDWVEVARVVPAGEARASFAAPARQGGVEGASAAPRVDAVGVSSANVNVEIVRLSRSDLHWEYRHSSGWQPGVIARVAVSWPMVADPDVMNRVREATKNRRQRQPLEWPSGGSTFRNPPGGKAGALIEGAGLKGFAIGGAQVSEKHANFIINRGGARAADILAVIQHVQKVVRDRHGLDLVPEVKLLGF